MKPVIAVAGGTGGMGRAIVDALLEATERYETKILSRSSNPNLESTLGCPVISVDYDSVESLRSTLEEHQIHTIICTLNVMNTPDHQLNLIRAAESASVTKRFIPAVWGVPLRQRSVAACFPNTANKMKASELLETTSLEYTLTYCGYFLDYFTTPHHPSYLTDLPIFVDLQNGVASLPGDGKTPVVFTHSFDVAKFTVRLLGEKQWPKDVWMIGDTLTLLDFAKMAEEVTRKKFAITYDSMEDLENGQISWLPCWRELPSEYKPSMAHIAKMFGQGDFNYESGQILNDLYPDVKPLTVRQALEKYWRPS